MEIFLENGIYISDDKSKGDYVRVAKLLNEAGLSSLKSEKQRSIFRSSQGVAFVFDANKEKTLIGCARALSDGISQTAIYNVVIDPAYRDKGLGSKLINFLIMKYKHTNIILYTHPNTLGWYKNLGFKNLKTALALFPVQEEAWLVENGFIDDDNM